MTTTILSFGLDVIILVALGVTIFYAVRLSQNLNKFRMHREEFNLYMGELSKNIETAENTVQTLQQASLTTADQLRRKVRDGQHLHDELQIIIDSAENIASRLEKNVTTPQDKESPTQKKRQKLEVVESEEAIAEGDDWFIEDLPDAPNNNTKPNKRKGMDGKIPSFFIQDREFEGDEDGSAAHPQENEFQSQAEKELYDALQKKKRNAS